MRISTENKVQMEKYNIPFKFLLHLLINTSCSYNVDHQVIHTLNREQKKVLFSEFCGN